MGSLIKAVEYYLPEATLSNQQLEQEFPDWSAKKVAKKIGIESRHIAGDDETSLDMAFEVCEKVLAGYDRKMVDFLLLCTQSPDYFLPTSACILQDRIKLRTCIRGSRL